ncbi:MAG: patatin-like phospholipase family protein [Prevotella sp.]|jgi:NTE family protein|nr:patatin-like phospholipase family protein [Prevotella sp.]MCH4215651.1 patatin-like phospholipase family protein [Prevotella sp.]MCH4250948.1 patatin-like phospholipase family protein [Prevotella sp.]MCI2088873.1 patatin-like phospholipase family protein [Prevotella sp.]MCI2126288.1 patatin-like phospholipase family protein [Prevotella sp.]
MNIFERLKQLVLPGRSHEVALVLGGGGARGFAYIGAIEVLEERGYVIHSVAGTSIGALIGGLWAAGRMKEVKEIVLKLNKKEVLSLMDVSIGLDHLMSGEKLLTVFNQLVGDTKIEDLPVNFCCSASDLVSGKEMVFRKGSLKMAMRASMSIPCFFKPVKDHRHIYVDGGVQNTLPLNRVARKKGDWLFAVNASAPDRKLAPAFVTKLKKPREGKFGKFLDNLPFHYRDFSENAMNIAMRVASLSIQANVQMEMELIPPDLCADIPMDRFGLFDFDKGEELIRFGRDEMSRKLDEFEQGRRS